MSLEHSRLKSFSLVSIGAQQRASCKHVLGEAQWGQQMTDATSCCNLQVTSHQLRQQKESERLAAAEEAKRRDLAAKREVLIP